MSWMKKVTNERVRKIVQAEETLATVLARRKLRYAGHVERDSNGKLIQLAVKGLIEGKKEEEDLEGPEERM